VIVVTGGSGHLGQWTIGALASRGHEVACLARRPLSEPTIAGVKWPGRVEPIVCDLSDRGSVAAAGSRLREATAVVHLAAHVPPATASNSDDDADETLRANVHGTVSLLSELRGGAAQSFVYASTFEVYGEPETLPVNESHPTRPTNYYGASKLCGEQYVDLAAATLGVAGINLRFPAIYGPGDTIARALGNFLRAAVANESITIQGDGRDRRDLVYAADAARAVILAIERPTSGTFNIADGRGYTIEEMARAAISATSSTSTIERAERAKPRADYVLDVSEAGRHLGWTPQIRLEEGLAAQAEWLRAESGENSEMA